MCVGWRFRRHVLAKRCGIYGGFKTGVLRVQQTVGLVRPGEQTASSAAMALPCLKGKVERCRF